jgi:hypothetical protein
MAGEVELYLLRVWKQVQGVCGFRAAVRPLDAQAAAVFSDPAKLARYLELRSAEPSQTTDRAGGDGAPTADARE